MAGVVAAAAAQAQRRVIEALKARGAVSPETAIAPPEQRPFQGGVMKSLIRAGVVSEAGGGKVYLNLARLADMQARQARARAVVLPVLGLLVLAMVVVAVGAILRAHGHG